MKLCPKEEKPLLYLSGSSEGEEYEKELVRRGCKHRCYSFGYVAKGAFNYTAKMATALEASLKLGVGVMLDSSAASFHVLAKNRNVGRHSRDDIGKLRDSLLTQYVEYVKPRGKDFDWYVNFDYTHDAKECWRMQRRLEKDGIHPVPVFHRGQDLDWLHRYCSEYKLVGLGNMMRAGYASGRFFLDKAFNLAAKHGTKMHGFAATTLSIMFMYPWHSIDSSSWLKVAAYGSIIHVDDQRGMISEMHLTDRNASGKTKYAHMDKVLRRQVVDEVESGGFDFGKLREDYSQRAFYNVWVYHHKLPLIRDIVSQGRKQWRSLL